jgi:8-oxo-dGTP pyrophosphatase MutT (NUDIX family)
MTANRSRLIDTYEISLKAFLRNGHGDILGLSGRYWNPDWKDKYDLPGGRIEVGEFHTPFAEILRRELREECGDLDIVIDAEPIAVARHLVEAEGDRPEQHVLYLFFEAWLTSGNVVHVSSEHTGARWFTTNEIAKDAERHFVSGNLVGLRSFLHRG